jgi:hypothetical protein
VTGGVAQGHASKEVIASGKDQDKGVTDKVLEEKKIAEDVRLVSKYIFPRQYALHNVFTCPRLKGAWPFPDYTVRNEEIEVGLKLICCSFNLTESSGFAASRFCQDTTEVEEDIAFDTGNIISP